MTGYRSKHFRHKCAERGCYIETLPDWTDLIACLPRNIRFTDVDGFVEINGHLLFMEEKQEGAPLPNGQRMALRMLSRQADVTVMIFRPRGDQVETLLFTGDYSSGWECMTHDQFKARLRRWAEWADGGRDNAA